MAKVAMMESGLRRKQTCEEIIDYIEMIRIKFNILAEQKHI